MKNNNYKFTIPKLCTRGGDINKSWYVYFYYTSGAGIKKQFRFKQALNTYDTKKEREREAGAMITVLHDRLLSGWSPIIDEIETTALNNDVKLIDALDNILSIKKSYITPRSYKTYYDQINLFKKWLTIVAHKDYLFVQNFNKKQAQNYLDYL
ncbi:MAG: hypothetical protein PHH37_03105 [Paludibacter sp.]|nr:hypothetical protein [Paludibacter sp.]